MCFNGYEFDILLSKFFEEYYMGRMWKLFNENRLFKVWGFMQPKFGERTTL